MFDILWLFAVGGGMVALPKYLRIIAYQIAMGRFMAERECYPLQTIQLSPEGEEEDNGEQGQA